MNELNELTKLILDLKSNDITNVVLNSVVAVVDLELNLENN